MYSIVFKTKSTVEYVMFFKVKSMVLFVIVMALGLGVGAPSDLQASCHSHASLSYTSRNYNCSQPFKVRMPAKPSYSKKKRSKLCFSAQDWKTGEVFTVSYKKVPTRLAINSFTFHSINHQLKKTVKKSNHARILKWNASRTGRVMIVDAKYQVKSTGEVYRDRWVIFPKGMILMKSNACSYQHSKWVSTLKLK